MAGVTQGIDGEGVAALGAAFYPSEDMISTDQLSRLIYALRHNLREKIIYFLLCVIVFRDPFGHIAGSEASLSADELARISGDPDLIRRHLGKNLPVLADMVNASVAQSFRRYFVDLMGVLAPGGGPGDMGALAGGDLAMLERHYRGHMGGALVADGEPRQKLARLLASGSGAANDETLDPVALAENAIGVALEIDRAVAGKYDLPRRPLREWEESPA